MRRQAHALRKKLEEYYRGPGAQSHVHIELPLGHYAPAFRVIEEEIQPVAAPKPIATKGWPLSPRLLVFAASIILVFALGWIAGHVSRPPGATAFASDMPGSMRWIWRQWLSDPSGATICLTTPQTILAKRYPEPHAESKMEEPIPESSPRARSLREFFHLPPGGAPVEYPSVGHFPFSGSAGVAKEAGQQRERCRTIKSLRSCKMQIDLRFLAADQGYARQAQELRMSFRDAPCKRG